MIDTIYMLTKLNLTNHLNNVNKKIMGKHQIFPKFLRNMLS